jgi:hypothetical protein
MLDLAFCLSLIALTPSGALLSPPEARRYATDICAVVQTPKEAAWAATVIDFEGSWDPRVERCEKTGDNGASLTLYQLQRHWLGKLAEKACQSHREATRVAIGVFRYLSRGRTIAEVFRAYAGCKPGDKRVTTRVQLYEKLMEMADD